MKKIIVLALCLVLALCATAFAGTQQTLTTLTSTTAVNVSGTVVNPDVINAVVKFDDLTYVYTNTWDVDSHTYSATLVAKEATTEGSVTTTYNTISVANHSNVDIAITPSFTPNVATGITLNPSFANSAADATLEEADQHAYGDYDGADALTYTLSFTVAVANTGATDAVFGTADGVFGTVTISIAKA